MSPKKETDYDWTDLLDPKGPSPNDVVCAMIIYKHWNIVLSRGVFKRVMDYEIENEIENEIEKTFQGRDLMSISNPVVFFGMPANLENCFIDGVKTLRNTKNNIPKLSFPFFEPKEDVIIDIDEYQKCITLCMTNED